MRVEVEDAAFRIGRPRHMRVQVHRPAQLRFAGRARLGSLARSHQALGWRVGHLEHMLGPAQRLNKGGCLPEEFEQPRLVGTKLSGGLDALGGLKHSYQNAFHRSCIAAQRTVAESKISVFKIAVARDWVELVFESNRFSLEHAVVDWLIDVPHLWPAGARGLPQAGGVFHAHQVAVRVVVELHQVSAPYHHHWELAGEGQFHRRPQALLPARRRPERSLRPVERAHQGRRFTVAQRPRGLLRPGNGC